MEGLSALLGLAALGAMGSGRLKVERRPRRYDKPIGPKMPTTRQQRRAMERASAKALSRLTHPTGDT